MDKTPLETVPELVIPCGKAIVLQLPSDLLLIWIIIQFTTQSTFMDEL